MPRNKTAAQGPTRDLNKSDALAQTNQIKYGCLFSHGTENKTKKIFSRSKSRNKNPGQGFSDFLVF